MIFPLMRRFMRRRGELSFEDARARRAIIVLAIYLVAIFSLHISAMMAFEKQSFGNAVWLTATTVTTVGYGDISAATVPGRWATVVLMYIGGIFALAKGAGDYFDYRASRRHRMLCGRWRWYMQDHVLLVNAPSNGAESYFNTLIRQFRETEWGDDRDILILTDLWPDGLPQSLQERGVVHVHGHGNQEGMLEAGDAAEAAAIVVLADDHEQTTADSVTFDIVHRARRLNANGALLAECIDDRNRTRLRDAGASSVVRPMRGYPEMMVRAVVAPGSEYIIEDLFTARGDECVRYEVAINGPSWAKLAAALMLNGAGTAIAYEKAVDGEIEINPLPDTAVSARALHLITKEGRAPSTDEVRRIASEAAA